MTGESSRHISVRDIAMIGMMTAALEAAKLSLSFLPNVELVTLMVILFTLCMGGRALFAVVAFVGVECLVWGPGPWTVMYLYIWPGLSILTLLCRRQRALWFWSVLSGMFGLLFGALCAIPYLFIGGIQTAVAWWIAGIPWDILHGISNFVICMVLFCPLRKVLERLVKTWGVPRE
ncbi:MAG: hypothetical protein K2O73_02665 [Lachnospiraceae bacterium]|nr:hypothetical protein [Lachnospiraceae bacterium]